MAKGYVAYTNQVWKKLEQELLLDAYLKLDCSDPSEDLDLFEDIAFEEDYQETTITEEIKYEVALYPMELYLQCSK